MMIPLILSWMQNESVCKISQIKANLDIFFYIIYKNTRNQVNVIPKLKNIIFFFSRMIDVFFEIVLDFGLCVSILASFSLWEGD